mgnify:CR=1 FL=1
MTPADHPRSAEPPQPPSALPFSASDDSAPYPIFASRPARQSHGFMGKTPLWMKYVLFIN